MKRSISMACLVAALVLFSWGAAEAQVVINEIMADPARD